MTVKNYTSFTRIVADLEDRGRSNYEKQKLELGEAKVSDFKMRPTGFCRRMCTSLQFYNNFINSIINKCVVQNNYLYSHESSYSSFRILQEKNNL